MGVDDDPTGWRADLLKDLAEARIEVRAWTFPSGYDLIKVAAYNRRMDIHDFIGRSALAVAVYDADDEVTWRQATRLEPPMRDLRRHNLPKRRLFGAGFGPWDIKEMQ